MTSQALVYNPKNINGSMYVDNSVNTVSNSVNDLTNNITSLYLSSQNYVIPSLSVANYTVNNVNTLNLSETSTIINVPSNGISWSSDGQGVISLSCSENNIDLSPLIQNNVQNNDSDLLTFQDYVPLLSPFRSILTYQFAFKDTQHFTYCSTATFGNMNTYRMASTRTTYDFNGLEGYYTAQGIYGIWFQYGFSTAIIATSIIISVADYTQSPDIIFVFGNNDPTFATGWSFVGGSRQAFTSLTSVNNYILTYPGSYLYYRVVIASANNTQFSVSGIKFATNTSVAGAVSVGTIANSAMTVGNTTNNTNVVGNTVIVNTPTIQFNSIYSPSTAPTIHNLPIPQSIVCDCSRSETASLVVNTTTPIYTWYNFFGYFQLQFIGMSVSVLPIGTNITVRADVYNSDNLFTHNIVVGSYAVSLNTLESPFNPYGLTNPILTTSNVNPILFPANQNGQGGYIKFYVTQVGSTTSGGGLKMMICGNLISV